VSHNFEWNSIMKDDDEFSFTPAIMLNMGSGTNTVMNKFGLNSANYVKTLKKRGKIDKLQNSPFEIESMGINFDLNYSIGHFKVSPQLYLDYYLPETTEKRLTGVFLINLGFEF
jgi:hypothetical protein